MCLGLCPCLPCHLSSLVTKGSDAASVLPAHAGSVLSIKALALCCLLAPKRRCNKGIFLRQAPAQTGCVERGDCKQQKAEHLLVCTCYSSCTCMGGTCKQCFLRGFLPLLCWSPSKQSRQWFPQSPQFGRGQCGLTSCFLTQSCPA